MSRAGYDPQLLAFRPRRKPPAPAIVNSWALKHINLRVEEPMREDKQHSLSLLRDALISARHVSCNDEVESVNFGYPVAPFGSLALQPNPQAQYGAHPPGLGHDGRHGRPERPGQFSPTELPSASVTLPYGHHITSQRQRPYDLPERIPGPRHGEVTGPAASSRPQERTAPHLTEASTARAPLPGAQAPKGRTASKLDVAVGDWDPDLLEGLDGLDDLDGGRDQVGGCRRGGSMVPSTASPVPEPTTRRQAVAPSRSLPGDAAARAGPSKSFGGDQQQGRVDAALRRDGDGTRAFPAGHQSMASGHGMPCVPAIGVDGGFLGSGSCLGPAPMENRPDGSSRWWDEFDRVFGSGTAGSATPGAAAAPPQGQGHAAGARKASNEPRQTKLTPGGGCALPPPPPAGAAWKSIRPGGMAAPAPGPSGMRASHGCEGEQQPRGQPQLRQAQLPFPAGLGHGKDASQEGSIGGSGTGTAKGPALAGAGEVAGGPAGARKRSRGASYPESEEPGQEGWDVGAVGAGGASESAGKAKKRAAKGGALVDMAVRNLAGQLRPFCEALDDMPQGGIRDASDPKVASELRRDISTSRVVLAGMLVAVQEGSVHQFASNMQWLTKSQRDNLLKARRLLAKDPAAAAALNAEVTPAPPPTPRGPGPAPSQATMTAPGPVPGTGVLASEHLERTVAFCVMCLDEQQYGELLASGGPAAGSGGGRPVDPPTQVPLYLLRIAGAVQGAASGAGAGRGGGAGTLPSPPAPAPSGALPRPVLLSLLDEVLVRAPCPVLCCNAKALLREAMALGWQSPPPERLRVMDPCVLTWMEAPQLAQRDEKEIECYSLEALCPRYGIDLQPPPGASAADGPLARVRRGLVAAGRLLAAVRPRVQSWLRPQAVQVEMQVSWLLARMEALGIAVDAAGLSRKAAAVRQRMDALTAAAAEALGGRAVNLGSSAQLAVVLYDDLGLPPPAAQGGGQGQQREGTAGRDKYGRARTHLTTDEAALKQIAHLHPLPNLVLQYRALQNVVSKWLEPEWLPPLMARSGIMGPTAGGGGGVRPGAQTGTPPAAPLPPPSPGRVWLPRLACSWNQTATATGRLSSSSPNLQAVTKYEVVVQLQAPVGGGDDAADKGEEAGGGGGEVAAAAGEVLRVVARDAFVAPAGRLLLSADYSQVELRLLAHLSGDLRLQELLRLGGEAGDAFRHIAAAWLRPGTAPADISSRDREQVKRVVYGIIYGMTPQGLAQQLAEHGMGLEEATALRSSFLRHFAGVQAFITSSLHHARRHGFVTTGLLGRRRPITGLSATDPRVRAEAERKVVNSIVQGTAADLMKCAMCMWASYNHPDTQRGAATLGGHTGNQMMMMVQGYHQHQQAAGSGASASHCSPAPVTGGARGGALPLLPPCEAELVAQIHDELLFECDARPESVRQLVAVVQSVMCDVVRLDVPLLVKVAVGQSWGGLKELPPDVQTPQQ